MRRFANERVLYVVLSLVIATVAWLYVATAQNPLVERIMALDLHVRDLNAAEVVVQAPNRVQVRLQGPRSALALLTPALLDASVDLSGLRPGEHRVPVYVAAPPQVHVLERTPPDALVVLDALTKQRVPVEVSLIGTPPQGVAIGTPRVSPQAVVVSGAAAQVEEVRHAIVTVDTANLRQQLVTSLPVRLVDANGQEVRGPKVDPSIVEATIPARPAVITKLVPVIPTIVGAPPQAYAVTGVTTDPQTVTLTGAGDVLQGVQAAPTGPIDLTSVKGDLTRRVALQVPPGVSASAQQATVVIHIGPAVLSRIFPAVPVRVVGAPSGVSLKVVPDMVEVQVEGPQDLVQRLSTRAVTVQVDAGGAKRGRRQVVPQAVLPRGIRLLAIHPARVIVIYASSS